MLTTLTTVAAMGEWRRGLQQNAKVGFVPTMGSLHAGHASLVARARRECDVVVASVFVNPTQFGPGEDFSRYPRDLSKDEEVLRSVGCDCLFAPTAQEMYNSSSDDDCGASASVVVSPAGTDSTEAKCRPGHFAGVATVVLKLFNIVRCDVAFFGAKDAVQCVVVRAMVRALNVPVQIVVCDTSREPDGLAMSSRNAYLSAQDRTVAATVFRALCAGRDVLVKKGDASRSAIVAETLRVVEAEPKLKCQYVSLADADTALEVEEVKSGRSAILSIAVFLGSTRLIDNVILQN